MFKLTAKAFALTILFGMATTHLYAMSFHDFEKGAKKIATTTQKITKTIQQDLKEAHSTAQAIGAKTATAGEMLTTTGTAISNQHEVIAGNALSQVSAVLMAPTTTTTTALHRLENLAITADPKLQQTVDYLNAHIAEAKIIVGGVEIVANDAKTVAATLKIIATAKPKK